LVEIWVVWDPHCDRFRYQRGGGLSKKFRAFLATTSKRDLQREWKALGGGEKAGAGIPTAAMPANDGASENRAQGPGLEFAGEEELLWLPT